MKILTSAQNWLYVDKLRWENGQWHCDNQAETVKNQWGQVAFGVRVKKMCHKYAKTTKIQRIVYAESNFSQMTSYEDGNWANS